SSPWVAPLRFYAILAGHPGTSVFSYNPRNGLEQLTPFASIYVIMITQAGSLGNRIVGNPDPIAVLQVDSVAFLRTFSRPRLEADFGDARLFRADRATSLADRPSR